MAKPQKPELVALAIERGIAVHAGMTNSEISNLLGPTSPSRQQQEYADVLAGQPVPLRTFAHARSVISDLEDLRNSQALASTGWQEGDILLWKDEYYLVVKQFGSQAWHRFQLQIVDLEPQGDGASFVNRTEQRAVAHNPCTLVRDGARRVDLSTWPVTLEDHPE